uniref:Pentraxin family member n=1 Tax=Ailuropoda melanoleuca TaxID=9646 RepID=A0A7N5JYF5_AILME
MGLLRSSFFLFLFLTCLSASRGNEDLQKKVFVFPAPSNSAVVVLNAPFQQPLTKFTACLRHFSLLPRAYALFSYATRHTDNELLIFKPRPNQYSLYVGGPFVTFTVPEKQKAAWEHICMSWDSTNGLVEFWLDGQPLPRMGLKKGYAINKEGSLVLGQEQDSVGGGFDVNQSFVGEISDVYLWDRVLTADEIGLVWSDGVLSDHLLNWKSLGYTMKGYVVLEKALL